MPSFLLSKPFFLLLLSPFTVHGDNYRPYTSERISDYPLALFGSSEETEQTPLADRLRRLGLSLLYIVVCNFWHRSHLLNV